MKFGLVSLLLLFSLCSLPAAAPAGRVEGLASSYLAAWKVFYPSAALAAGAGEAAARLESFSPPRVAAWLAVNRRLQAELETLPSAGLSPMERGDVRLLRRQCRDEITRWGEERPHLTSPGLYAGIVSQALTHLLTDRRLGTAERLRAVQARLRAVIRLCRQARGQLRRPDPAGGAAAAIGLRASAHFLEEKLPGIASTWTPAQTRPAFARLCRAAAGEIERLAASLPHSAAAAVPPAPLGEALFARKLRIYTDSDLTPEHLERLAAAEIERVRGLILAQARLYWQRVEPGQAPPEDFAAVVGRAMRDMEAGHAGNQREFLQFFRDLTDRAERFVQEKNIAAVPLPRTLLIDLSPPHFAGAAVGGVYPAGPFAPQADTLFYLPSVPDEAPAAQREDFYRSFNHSFNTMIIVHEMLPGHYLQGKTAALHAPPWRSLFADDLYVEGWATLCEQICLDAGWDDDRPLTRLAHLRKILENAVRAYVSVQVHCRGWDQQTLTRFAVETGLLAPQFAVNLWRRVQDSPLQITSYFLGFHAFRALLEREQKRAGTAFDLRAFCDRILRAGPLPIDEIARLFPEESRP